LVVVGTPFGGIPPGTFCANAEAVASTPAASAVNPTSQVFKLRTAMVLLLSLIAGTPIVPARSGP
jgi:hypothetical protein